MANDTIIVPRVWISAPLVARGWIGFVNIKPDQKSPLMWICDECAQRVTPANFRIHAKSEHGLKFRGSK